MQAGFTPTIRPSRRPKPGPPATARAPGNLMFYKGSMFPQWRGSALISGLVSGGVIRVTVDRKGGATAVQRWSPDKRISDIEEATDGALWVLEDAQPGGLYRLTSK